MSMSATENSSASPRRGGIARRKAMIAPPTSRIVMLWPIPQSAPMPLARRTEHSSLTIVVTATT